MNRDESIPIPDDEECINCGGRFDEHTADGCVGHGDCGCPSFDFKAEEARRKAWSYLNEEWPGTPNAKI